MFFRKEPRKVVGVDGINNDIDKIKIERALEDLIDISRVKIDINKKTIYVYFDHSVDDILITDTIEKLGYTVTGIKEEN